MKVCLALVLAFGLCALGACGEDSAPGPPGDGGPLVVWERAGGIAGVGEHLEIKTDGSAAITVGFEGRHRKFELTSSELQEVRDRVEAAELDMVESPPEDAICADCFSYELEAGGESAAWDSSVGLPDSVSALGSLLSQLAAEHYPKGTQRIESMA